VYIEFGEHVDGLSKSEILFDLTETPAMVDPATIINAALNGFQADVSLEICEPTHLVFKLEDNQ
jgi:hypothetical protein